MIDRVEENLLVSKKAKTSEQKEEWKKTFAEDYGTVFAYALKSQKEAESLKIELSNFQILFKSHKASLTGLKTAYSAKHKINKNESEKLEQKITELTNLITSLEKEYNQQVVIAATTPTYAWVPILGLIAASTVAGIYGFRAVKTLELIKAKQQELKQFKTKDEFVKGLITAFTSAENFVEDADKKVGTVVAILDNVIGDWQKIINSLSVFITPGDQQNRILEKSFSFAEVKYESIIEKWEKIRADAEAYGRYSIKSVTGPAAIQTPNEVDVLQLENAYRIS